MDIGSNIVYIFTIPIQNVTIIPHYVYSINQVNDEFVMVSFRQIVSNESMNNYLQRAITDWKLEGFPGEPSKEMLNQIREDRFKNQFQMKFPYHEWTNRNLRINDNVEIDMPLALDDIKSAEKDTGE